MSIFFNICYRMSFLRTLYPSVSRLNHMTHSYTRFYLLVSSIDLRYLLCCLLACKLVLTAKQSLEHVNFEVKHHTKAIGLLIFLLPQSSRLWLPKCAHNGASCRRHWLRWSLSAAAWQCAATWRQTAPWSHALLWPTSALAAAYGGWSRSKWHSPERRGQGCVWVFPRHPTELFSWHQCLSWIWNLWDRYLLGSESVSGQDTQLWGQATSFAIPTTVGHLVPHEHAAISNTS